MRGGLSFSAQRAQFLRRSIAGAPISVVDLVVDESLSHFPRRDRARGRLWAAAGFDDTLLRWNMKPEVIHVDESLLYLCNGDRARYLRVIYFMLGKVTCLLLPFAGVHKLIFVITSELLQFIKSWQRDKNHSICRQGSLWKWNVC